MINKARAKRVSIPLKSGRCCKGWALHLLPQRWSQSLWSQGGAASSASCSVLLHVMSQSLWSQGGAARLLKILCQLEIMSQSLWSQGGAARLTEGCSLNWPVSIPLKSGRCCKFTVAPIWQPFVSQSLWSQGGAARSKRNVSSSFGKSQSLWSQGGAARQ